MVHVIMSYGVHRNQAGRHWVSKAAIFTIASGAAGGGAGAALGAIGGLADERARLGVATLLGLVGLAVGLTELTRFRFKPLQVERETDQRWMDHGALRGAAMNGTALGVGFTSRIDFWLFWAIPAGAVLSGSVVGGLIIFGTYGLARGVAPWILIAAAKLLERRSRRFEQAAEWLLSRRTLSRSLAGGYLIGLGAFVVTAIGI
jgi:hypothetical protein